MGPRCKQKAWPCILEAHSDQHPPFFLQIHKSEWYCRTAMYHTIAVVKKIMLSGENKHLIWLILIFPRPSCPFPSSFLFYSIHTLCLSFTILVRLFPPFHVLLFYSIPLHPILCIFPYPIWWPYFSLSFPILYSVHENAKTESLSDKTFFAIYMCMYIL